ncbi:MAG: glycosyl hydrolase family 28 protein [Deltaproteobacteria bacterium]|nr:glycosyl hydrolase family 28 protein [Deltaproteobacteria bacterium]
MEKRNAAGIQAAIDTCAKRGGGVAVVPPGLTISGPIWLKDNVELHLDYGAIVQMSRAPADWPKDVPALVNAKGVENVAVTGGGTFDGAATWAYEPVRRPDVEIAEEQKLAESAGVEMKRYYRTGEVQKYLFLLQDSHNIRFEQVTVKNAPYWNVRLQDCSDVKIHAVTVLSDLEKGINSDGIDIVSSSNVVISDSTVITADDAICIKSVAFEDESAPANPVNNILVTNSILGSSSTPMMIGTETHANISHVVFSNIVVRDSNKVIGINVQDGGTVSDVRFSNITFETNRRHWNWWGSAELMKFVLKRREPTSPLGKIEHITIDGAQGSARGTSVVAGHADRPLSDIKISNVYVRMLPENKPDKRATHGFVFESIDGLQLQSVDLQWDTQTPEPKWGSAYVFKNIVNLKTAALSGKPGNKKHDPIVRQNVR